MKILTEKDAGETISLPPFCLVFTTKPSGIFGYTTCYFCFQLTCNLIVKLLSQEVVYHFICCPGSR